MKYMQYPPYTHDLWRPAHWPIIFLPKGWQVWVPASMGIIMGSPWDTHGLPMLLPKIFGCQFYFSFSSCFSFITFTVYFDWLIPLNRFTDFHPCFSFYRSSHQSLTIHVSCTSIHHAHAQLALLLTALIFPRLKTWLFGLFFASILPLPPALFQQHISTEQWHSFVLDLVSPFPFPPPPHLSLLCLDLPSVFALAHSSIDVDNTATPFPSWPSVGSQVSTGSWLGLLLLLALPSNWGRDMQEHEPYYTGISPEINMNILILSFFQDSEERGIVE